MISASVAASTVTDFATLSSVHDNDRHDGSTVEMSTEEEDEDDVDIEPNEDEVDGEVDAARIDPSAASAAINTRASRKLGDSGSEDGVQTQERGANDEVATPLDNTKLKTSREAGRTPDAAEGGGGGDDTTGIISHDADTNAA